MAIIGSSAKGIIAMTSDQSVTVHARLSETEFIKANYYLLYRNWSTKLITGLGVFLIVLSLFTAISNLVRSTGSPDTYFGLFLGLFFALGSRATVYFTAKRNYRSGRFSENMTYVFTPEEIQIIGESFSSKFTWSKIYRVTENKTWVLIWQSRQQAHFIPKRDFTAEGLLRFQEIVGQQKGLKKK
jgi:hypothetical protein